MWAPRRFICHSSAAASRAQRLGLRGEALSGGSWAGKCGSTFPGRQAPFLPRQAGIPAGNALELWSGHWARTGVSATMHACMVLLPPSWGSGWRSPGPWALFSRPGHHACMPRSASSFLVLGHRPASVRWLRAVSQPVWGSSVLSVRHHNRRHMWSRSGMWCKGVGCLGWLGLSWEGPQFQGLEWSPPTCPKPIICAIRLAV